MGNNLEGFSQRLKEILADQGLPQWGRQRFLSKQFNVAHPSAKRWLDGIGFPETAKLAAIAEWSNTSVDWLLTGRGPKHPIDINNPELLAILEMLSTANPEQLTTYKKLLAVVLNKNL